MTTKSKAHRGKRQARKTPSIRNSRAIERTEADHERDVLDCLARDLLGVCIKALMQFGANPGKGMIDVRSFPCRAKYAREMLGDVDKVARIHTHWNRKTGYFDEDGHPIIISASGPPPSYEALCTDCGLAADWERLLALSLRFRMCSRVANGRLTFLSEIALFTGVPSFVLAYAVVSIERHLKAIEFNARPGRNVSESLVDRTAWVNLSEREFRQFATAMRGILHAFIESSDRRLLAAVARDASRSQKGLRRRISGVTAFIFRD